MDKEFRHQRFRVGAYAPSPISCCLDFPLRRNAAIVFFLKAKGILLKLPCIFKVSSINLKSLLIQVANGLLKAYPAHNKLIHQRRKIALVWLMSYNALSRSCLKQLENI